MDDLLIKYKRLHGMQRHNDRFADFGKELRLRYVFQTLPNSRDEIIIYLFHWVCELAEKYGFCSAVLGVHRMGWSRRATSVNDHTAYLNCMVPLISIIVILNCYSCGYKCNGWVQAARTFKCQSGRLMVVFIQVQYFHGKPCKSGLKHCRLLPVHS